jgi:hypothetical protein
MAEYISERAAGQIIGDSIRIYRSNFPILFIVSALPLLPFVVLQGLAAGNEVLSVLSETAQTILSIFTLGATTVAVSDICLGNRPTVKRSYAALFRVFWKYLGTYLLYVMAFVGGGLLLVLPGLYAMVALMFSLPACIIERRGPIESCKRSLALCRDNFWRVAGILLLAVLIFVIGIVIVSVIVGVAIGLALSPESPLLEPAGGLIGTMMAPFVQIVAVLLYYDLRARKENFDGAALASELMT